MLLLLCCVIAPVPIRRRLAVRLAKWREPLAVAAGLSSRCWSVWLVRQAWPLHLVPTVAVKRTGFWLIADEFATGMA